nr:DDB1- and CUL4-associated factor 8-like protein 2 isoform X1 [Drosophila takahashii]
MHREHNIINRIGWRGGHTSDQSFGQGFYGSRQAVEHLILIKTLKTRLTCSLNFNRDGDLLGTGDESGNVTVWDWENNRALHRFCPAPRNVEQTKFMDSTGFLGIMSSNLTGEVFLTIIPPSGGDTRSQCLYKHKGSTNDFLIVPQCPYEVMSVGEYGAVNHFDVRTSDEATTMVNCVDQEQKALCLRTIAHHPFSPEFCVGGDDFKLRVFDKRKLTEPFHEKTPNLVKKWYRTEGITCIVYNHSGSEILACFHDGGIFLYDSRNYNKTEFLHFYEKHYSEINFFGPRSEYIVTSDSRSMYFYDKKTEAIISESKFKDWSPDVFVKPHPWKPLLATAHFFGPGVKIWTPNGQT